MRGLVKKASDGLLRLWARLQCGSRGDFVQQALFWALIVVVAIAILAGIGYKVVQKFTAINNALD
ncbi:hypothetical protein Adeg_0783 [Ammonifex degensii KC4]|uniref:Flp family type IVb pilin n=1 Tax=Ammonifex degensii (strain DSM 10501 / KC4) TaxID=429009 RepID=C9RCE9_AMMDK|nr:hypothetical protein [Ammonifex degensii]ACX51926.1 hypothetical protein Adeg_0783 [Ammonifex degensii KC4]